MEKADPWEGKSSRLPSSVDIESNKVPTKPRGKEVTDDTVHKALHKVALESQGGGTGTEGMTNEATAARGKNNLLGDRLDGASALCLASTSTSLDTACGVLKRAIDAAYGGASNAGGLKPLSADQATAVEEAGGRCIFGHCGERVLELSKNYPDSKQVNVYAADGAKLDLKPGLSEEEWSEHVVLETDTGTTIDPLLEKQADNWDDYVDAVFESGVSGKKVTRAKFPK